MTAGQRPREGFGAAAAQGVPTREELQERANAERELEMVADASAEAFGRARCDARPLPAPRAVRPLALDVTSARRPTSGTAAPDAHKVASRGAEKARRDEAVAAVLEEARRRAARKPSRGNGPGGVATSAGAAFRDPRYGRGRRS